MVQCPRCSAESARGTRSRTSRSAAQVSSVSAAGASRTPSTTSAGPVAFSRSTVRPERCRCRSRPPTAAKTGCGTGAGSHQPRSAAPVRWVKTAVAGSTRAHARSRRARSGSMPAACTPRVTAVHPARLTLPRTTSSTPGAW